MAEKRECEFCLEIAGHPLARFSRIYADISKSRVSAESASFIAVPTLGQLFVGSMLIIPRRHVATLSLLDKSELSELQFFRNVVKRRLSTVGFPFSYEHGAQACTGSGCGIYHAHLHVLPLPTPLRADAFCRSGGKASQTFIDALCQLRNTPEYLVFEDATGSCVFTDPSNEGVTAFESQFIRKRLAGHFGVQKHWDWRKFEQPEEYLLKTLQLFEDASVPERQAN